MPLEVKLLATGVTIACVSCLVGLFTIGTEVLQHVAEAGLAVGVAITAASGLTFVWRR